MQNCSRRGVQDCEQVFFSVTRFFKNKKKMNIVSNPMISLQTALCYCPRSDVFNGV